MIQIEEEFAVRIGLDGYTPTIYWAQDSTGKRIYDDFLARIAKADIVRDEVYKEINKYSKSPNDKIDENFDVQFVEYQELISIMSEVVREVFGDRYITYQGWSEELKRTMTEAISEQIIKSADKYFTFVVLPSITGNTIYSTVQIYLGPNLKQNLTTLFGDIVT
jgi:hypothetical protein